VLQYVWKTYGKTRSLKMLSIPLKCSSALLVQITDDSYPPLPVERDKRDCLNFQ